MGDCAEDAALTLKPVNSMAHTFDPGRTPPSLKKYEREPNWKLPDLSGRYPRLSTDRATAARIAAMHTAAFTAALYPELASAAALSHWLRQQAFKAALQSELSGIQ